MRPLSFCLAGIFAAMLLCAPAAPAAPTAIFSPEPGARLHLDLPFFEAPFNVMHGYDFPSTGQATALTTDVAELAHYGLGRVWSPFSDNGGEKGLGLAAVSAFDGLMFFFAGPLSSAWNHEEWHRAVLTRTHTRSTNPLSTRFAPPLLDPQAIEIDAADTASLKAQRPADYAHVSIAGFDSHYALALRFEKNAFFEDQPTQSNFVIGLNYMLPPIYHLTCLGEDVANSDCSIFTTHLYAPQETPDQAKRPVSDGERSYMQLMLGLSLVNFLDPFILGIRSFESDTSSGRKVRWNAAVRALPTPFGQDVRLDFFLKTERRGFLFSAHNAFNSRSYFPAIEGEWRDHLPIGVDVQLRSGFWFQPEAQSFRSATHRPGGRIGLRVGVPFANARVVGYADAEGKTAGWVLGSPFLDANVTVTTGLALNLF